MKVYNAEGIILGRLASHVAKDLLMGEEVRVVNSEKAIISGAKANTLAREHTKRNRKGYPLKSQTHSRLADRLVRRTIRGMLPWKEGRGKEAYQRVLCYIGVPAEFSDKELITLTKHSKDKLTTQRYIVIAELTKLLGGKQ